MGQAAPADILTSPGVRPAGLKRASELVDESVEIESGADSRWSFQSLKGRLIELVGDSQSANVSLAARLILEAQNAGNFAAWIATHRDVFFPPDVAAAGVDLAALPVVWATGASGRELPDQPLGSTSSSRPQVNAVSGAAGPASRTAERLLRSGAFGLVVIDLARDLTIAPPSQGRLLRLAESHDALVLVLRRKREDGRYAGSLVTVRCESSSEQIAPGRFRVTVTSTKDKREGPGWTRASEFSGPPGLY